MCRQATPAIHCTWTSSKTVTDLEMTMQAYGIQLEVCLCAWDLRFAHTSHQHAAQADTTDLALLSHPQRQMARQGIAILMAKHELDV